MKHRAVTVFIVVLASLAATPQALQQLASLKDAAGQRLNAGIWSAFLSVNGRKVEGSARERTLPTVAEPARPAAFELASRPTRAQRAETRASRSAENVARHDDGVEAASETFQFKLVGEELASVKLDGVDMFEVGERSRLMVRAPEAPVRLAVPSPPVPGVKAYGGRPLDYTINGAFKGLDVKSLLELHRTKKEYVRKVEAVRGAATALRAEAERAAEAEWKAEQQTQPCPTTRSNPRLNCETEEEELMM